MARDGCDPCCNPSEAARSVQTRDQAILIILCQMVDLLSQILEALETP